MAIYWYEASSSKTNVKMEFKGKRDILTPENVLSTYLYLYLIFSYLISKNCLAVPFNALHVHKTSLREQCYIPTPVLLAC